MTASGTPPTEAELLAALKGIHGQRARQSRQATQRRARPDLKQASPLAQVPEAASESASQPGKRSETITIPGGSRIDPETGERIEIPDDHEIIDIPPGKIIDIERHGLVGVPFHGNQMLDTWFLVQAASKWRTVARITVPHVKANGERIDIPLGTGFLVGPGMLLSNSHVITNFFAHHAYADFDYIDTPAGVDLPVASHRLAPDVFLVVDEVLDYTLVAVEPVATNGASLAGRGWSPIGASLQRAYPGARVNIMQHPDGETQRVALRDNHVIESNSTEYLHYYADTKTHSSGSPVWDDDWNLVALHHASIARWTDEEGRILRSENGPVWNWQEETSHMVEWEANEGVGIHAIRSDLNARAAAMDPARLARLGSCFLDSDASILPTVVQHVPAPTPPTPTPPEPPPKPPAPDPVEPPADDPGDGTPEDVHDDPMDAWAAFDD